MTSTSSGSTLLLLIDFGTLLGSISMILAADEGMGAVVLAVVNNEVDAVEV
jgi:hypothetical protein